MQACLDYLVLMSDHNLQFVLQFSFSLLGEEMLVFFD
jgi:hypothetical protein